MKNNNLLVIAHNYRAFVKDQIEKLSDNFNKVTVLSRYNPISEISNIFPINYLEPFRKKSLIDLSNKPCNINVEVTPIVYIPTDSGYKSLGERHFKVVEKKIMNDNIKFDLIHSHFTWSAGYVGAKIKEKYDLPFIVTAHGRDIYEYPFIDEIWKNKIEYVLNTADYIITVSNKNLKCIRRLNVRTPVKVIPNGFNSTLFYPRNSKQCRAYLNLPLDKKILVTVGSLEYVKGHHYLVDAMYEIVKHRKDVFCIILGSGVLKNKLKKAIKSSGLENYVKLVGERKHEEVSTWINACDLFILPSLNEGNPTVMFECLGCGKPFIGTRVGGVPEIITSENYGLLCGPKDYMDLSKNILVALEKEWNYDDILNYSKNFYWENLTKDILKIYNTLLCI